MKPLVFCLILVCSIFSCSKPEQKSPATTKKAEQKSTHSNINAFAIGTLVSYDNERELERSIAFFVDSNIIAARLSEVINANRAIFNTWSGQEYNIEGFVAIDRTNRIALLQCNKASSASIALLPNIIADTVVVYPTEPKNKLMSYRRGRITDLVNVLGAKRYITSVNLYKNTNGSPMFVNGECVGIGYSDIVEYEKQNLIIPSPLIVDLLKNKTEKARPFSELKSNTDKATSEANKRIKGIEIETAYGNIKIKLSNQTPIYRDNFIALTKEKFYDSLLIHRVIPGFCIQSGAADSRYATKDELVGWQGPGYTLPANLSTSLYHKRGTIGSPRKPDSRNKKLRSDGSQFYIVTGRTYTDNELDEITKKTGYKFSAQQRQIYKTIGGAPHLDGSYTIFGEVVSGLDVADQINKVDIDGDYRPLKDIRIKRIRILK